jgi:CheY-like chemotaxis protein
MAVDGKGVRRVLVVEDDPDIRATVKDLLQAEGYEVFEAENGRDGLEVLGAIERPCLILLDMMMPVLDGSGFMQLLRCDEALVSIPVVVVSAGTAAAAGTQGFMRKPFNLDQLVHVVKQYCGSGQAS